uniref:Uncharacterized protein n=1 Tax=Physcomitrium patens TaxID=3218 RepID=A0A7I3Z0Z2_PHYPA
MLSVMSSMPLNAGGFSSFVLHSADLCFIYQLLSSIEREREREREREKKKKKKKNLIRRCSFMYSTIIIYSRLVVME